MAIVRMLIQFVADSDEQVLATKRQIGQTLDELEQVRFSVEISDTGKRTKPVGSPSQMPSS